MKWAATTYENHDSARLCCCCCCRCCCCLVSGVLGSTVMQRIGEILVPGLVDTSRVTQVLRILQVLPQQSNHLCGWGGPCKRHSRHSRSAYTATSLEGAARQGSWRAYSGSHTSSLLLGSSGCRSGVGSCHQQAVSLRLLLLAER